MSFLYYSKDKNSLICYNLFQGVNPQEILCVQLEELMLQIKGLKRAF